MNTTSGTPEDEQLSQSHAPTPSELAALYPRAKTEQERHQDTLRRQKLLQSRLPKHPHSKITFASTILFSLLILLAVNAQRMWEGGLAGVSFSFVLLLIVFLLIGICINYTTTIFYAFGQSVRLFYALYICIAFSIFGASVSGWFGDTTGYLWLLIAAGLHGAGTLTILKSTLKTRPT